MFVATVDLEPFEIEEDEDGYFVLVEIAEDPQSGRTVYVESRLSPAPLVGVGDWEFSFSIIVLYDEGQQPFVTQDRNVAAEFIPEDARPAVLRVVADCLIELVNQVTPQGIYRVTKEVNPHPKALHKHDVLTNCLKLKGYSVVESGTDPLQRRFWHMRRYGC